MEPKPIHLHRLEATLTLQFPHLDSNSLLQDISIQLSRSTGRIRSVFDKNGNLLFSLRPLDGHFIPSFEGAKRIMETGYHGNVVVMNDEAAPFVAKGKTAFCKHVLSAHPSIVPNCEVFLVDKDGELLAVGNAIHPAYAMEQLHNGPAVKVRHGRDR